MRKLVAVVAALAVFLGSSAESCKEGQSNPGVTQQYPTLVVSIAMSSTQAGFDWSVDIAGTKGKKRFWSGHEKTRDRSERFEVRRGQDTSVTLTVSGSNKNSYTCDMRVRGGEVKGHEIGVGRVQCFKTVADLFKPGSDPM